MVKEPSSYLWSSFAVNSGWRSDPLITPHAEFEALATDADGRYSAYRRLFDDRIDTVLVQSIRDATNAGYPLASQVFKERVLAPLGWKIEPGKPGPRAASPDAVYVVEPEFGL
jgi:putative transposase